MADRDDIERVRQATNIVELIEGVTTVRKAGRAVMAVCPFHQEKTASMSIDAARGLFNCFGCGKGGDVFTFLSEAQGLTFSESLELLATRAGITLEHDPKAAKREGERRETVDVVDAAGSFFMKSLKDHPDAGHARSYVRGRGYEVDVVDQFEIGYAPDGWDELSKHLRSLGFKDRQMEAAGLAKRGRQGKLYDHFRDRLIFPIRNVRGEMVGFGGRLLRGEGAKYINTPETRLYKKAELLYGLDRARSEIAKRGFAVVVEGYTDVIALHLAGYPVAVATCGTALGEDHFDLLRRFCDKIVLAFDADQAGAGAAIRGDELKLPAELALDLRVAVMPEGRDPAELVQEGQVDLLSKAVDDSEPLMLFRVNRELAEYDLAEPEGRARAIRRVVPLIARQSDSFARREYARLVARRTGTELDPILDEIERAVATAPRDRKTTTGGPPSLRGADLAEREVLRHLLAGTAPLQRVSAELFRAPGAAASATWLIDHSAGGQPVSIHDISDDSIGAMLRRLALVNEPLSPADDVLRRLERRRSDDSIATLKRRLESLDPDRDAQEYSATFNELIALEQAKRRGSPPEEG
jgi:DNA primase